MQSPLRAGPVLGLALALLLAPALPSTHAAAPPPTVTLFDGASLTGWDARGQAVFRVEDGVIVGETGRGGHGWLCTPRTYGDFRLELEVKPESGNSGIQVRSRFPEGDRMVGYQIEVDPSDRAWSGGLYEQGRRGWLQNLTDNEPARKAFKKGEWNHYRIECVGDSIRSWINGVPATDYRDSMDIEGLIALQVHSGRNARVRFRNIRIQDLGRHAWKPLWNGKDLSGWHVIGKSSWKIEDGAIVGRNAASEPEFGHVVSDQSYTDFTVRLRYKAVRGNCGLYFRIEKKGYSGVTGFQAEIDAQNDAGGLYETNGRAWVSQPKPEDVKKWFRPGDWNQMTVSAHGRRVVVNVNGWKSAEIKDDPGRLEGPLALQVHGGQDVEVHYKDIEILEPVRE